MLCKGEIHLEIKTQQELGSVRLLDEDHLGGSKLDGTDVLACEC